MAKKSFKDAPTAAAMFISTEQEPQPVKVTITEEPAEPLHITAPVTYSSWPAQAAAGTATPPQGYKANPAYIETKSKRVQLLMQPTLHARVKAAAEAQGLSFNDLVHRILEDAVKE